MKKTIIAFILGGIIFSSITATAAYVYTARDIGYQPSDENWSVDNVQEALTELKTDVNNINNKVEGIERVYKAGEVELVALVSDDSFYKDSNGKYVLSNSDTGRTLLADTSTYKSLASTDDCIGEVGADTATPFSGLSMDLLWTNSSPATMPAQTISLDLSSYQAVKILYTGNGYYADYSYNGIALARVGQTICLGGRLNNNALGAGRYVTVSNTGLTVSSSAQLNEQGTYSINGYGVPLKIWGIKPSRILDDLLAQS